MLRGIAMLTICYMHFSRGRLFPGPQWKILGAYTFAFISGVLMARSGRRYECAERWGRLRLSLIRPYVIYSLALLAMDAILVVTGLMDPLRMGGDFIKTILLRGIGTLWYLPAMFGGMMLFTISENSKGFLKIGIYCISLLTIAVYAWWQMWGADVLSLGVYADFLWRNIMAVPINILTAFIFIGLGYYLTVSGLYSRIGGGCKSWRLTIAAALIIVAMGILNINMEGYVPKDFKSLIVTVPGSVGMLLLCECVESKSRIFAPFRYIGKNSLTVMVWHYCVCYTLLIAIHRYFTGEENFGIHEFPCYFLLTMAVMPIAVRIVERLKSKYRVRATA